MTGIRTWVVAATRRNTNHYTIRVILYTYLRHNIVTTWQELTGLWMNHNHIVLDLRVSAVLKFLAAEAVLEDDKVILTVGKCGVPYFLGGGLPSEGTEYVSSYRVDHSAVTDTTNYLT